MFWTLDLYHRICSEKLHFKTFTELLLGQTDAGKQGTSKGVVSRTVFLTGNPILLVLQKRVIVMTCFSSEEFVNGYIPDYFSLSIYFGIAEAGYQPWFVRLPGQFLCCYFLGNIKQLYFGLLDTGCTIYHVVCWTLCVTSYPAIFHKRQCCSATTFAQQNSQENRPWTVDM